jgi:hypothetical protein
VAYSSTAALNAFDTMMLIMNRLGSGLGAVASAAGASAAQAQGRYEHVRVESHVEMKHPTSARYVAQHSVAKDDIAGLLRSERYQDDQAWARRSREPGRWG